MPKLPETNLRRVQPNRVRQQPASIPACDCGRKWETWSERRKRIRSGECGKRD